MPIGASQGTLDVENAKFRASELMATTSVGIGTASDANYSVTVFKENDPEIRIQEGTVATAAARIYSNNSNLVIQSGTNFTTGSPGNIHFSTMGGDTTHLSIQENGNVFVNSNLSTQRLTLNNVSISTTTSLQQVTDVGNVTSNTVQFTNPTTAFVTTGNVEVGTANLFVDTTTGNVGIGSNNPTQALDIVGAINLTGKITSPYFKAFPIFSKEPGAAPWVKAYAGTIKADSMVVVICNSSGYTSTASTLGTWTIQYSTDNESSYVTLDTFKQYFNTSYNHEEQSRVRTWQPSSDVDFTHWKVLFSGSSDANDFTDLVLIVLPI